MRGSQKHVLDWVSQPAFKSELPALISPVPLTGLTAWAPRDRQHSQEAQLDAFGRAWLPGHPAWDNLRRWWLAHPGRMPMWDIVAGGVIENRRGLVLVEAKAHANELQVAGKSLSPQASARSRENHAQIGRAIDQARAGWQQIDRRVAITRDSHYQLANRLAYAWKVAMLGLPVALVFLGFTGDEGMRDVGEPFRDGRVWERRFHEYAGPVVPAGLFEQRIDLGAAPVWLLVRSRPILNTKPVY